MAEPTLQPSVFDRLLKDRIIWLGSEVRDDNANEIAAKLLLLAAKGIGLRLEFLFGRLRITIDLLNDALADLRCAKDGIAIDHEDDRRGRTRAGRSRFWRRLRRSGTSRKNGNRARNRKCRYETGRLNGHSRSLHGFRVLSLR